MPQKICGDCLQKVEAACEIKEKCIETDQLLRRYLKTEPETIVEEHLDPEAEYGVNIKVEPNPDWFVNFDSHTANDEMPKTEPYNSRDVEDEDDTWMDYPVESMNTFARLPKPKVERAPRIATLGAKPKQRKPKPRDEDFKCLFCNQIFPKIVEKTRHVKTEHANEIVCRICKKKRATVMATENCMRDHIYGCNYLCQVSWICNRR